MQHASAGKMVSHSYNLYVDKNLESFSDHCSTITLVHITLLIFFYSINLFTSEWSILLTFCTSSLKLKMLLCLSWTLTYKTASRSSGKKLESLSNSLNKLNSFTAQLVCYKPCLYYVIWAQKKKFFSIFFHDRWHDIIYLFSL